MPEKQKPWEELREKLADIEHQRWSKWQKYVHSKCVDCEHCSPDYVSLPMDDFQHWERQINTDYKDLSEEEKDSDRKEVDKYLPIIKNLFMGGAKPRKTVSDKKLMELWAEEFDKELAGILFESICILKDGKCDRSQENKLSVDFKNIKSFIKSQIDRAFKKGYNKRLKDEGKTGERWQHLYL